MKIEYVIVNASQIHNKTHSEQIKALAENCNPKYRGPVLDRGVGYLTLLTSTLGIDPYELGLIPEPPVHVDVSEMLRWDLISVEKAIEQSSFPDNPFGRNYLKFVLEGNDHWLILTHNNALNGLKKLLPDAEFVDVSVSASADQSTYSAHPHGV